VEIPRPLRHLSRAPWRDRGELLLDALVAELLLQPRKLGAERPDLPFKLLRVGHVRHALEVQANASEDVSLARRVRMRLGQRHARRADRLHLRPILRERLLNLLKTFLELADSSLDVRLDARDR